MIVKDEEANLEACLDSLLPIIIEPDCELIIVDTGSKDRTIEIAKKHFAKVYQKEFIPWDFSKARNYAISKATGFRIMIIDADETLDTNSLYHLKDALWNPAFDNYPTIFFTIKSFYDEGMKQYTYFKQPRIFLRESKVYNKSDGKFKYEGHPHNQPMCRPPYLYAEEVFLNHYGYLWSTDGGLEQKKSERTLPPLLDRVRKDPTDTHALTHIIKSYRIRGEHFEQIRYGKMWIEQMQKIKDNDQFHEGWFGYLEVFCDIVDAYILTDQIDKALKTVEITETFSNRIAELYMIMGNYYIGREDEKAIEYFERVLDIYYTQGILGADFEDLISTNLEMMLPRILNYMAIWYFQHGDMKKAGQYLQDGIYLNKSQDELRWDIWNCDKKIGVDNVRTENNSRKISKSLAVSEL